MKLVWLALHCTVNFSKAISVPNGADEYYFAVRGVANTFTNVSSKYLGRLYKSDLSKLDKKT
jgi:hypothetical protein